MVLIAVLCGLLVGGGVWLAATGLRATDRPATPGLTSRWRWSRSTGYKLTAALGVAVVVGTLTRWPVAAILAGLLAWAAPSLLGGGKAEAVQVAKLEAIASWTEALRGSLRSYAGIEQAIRDTATVAKPPIATQVAGLAAALQAGVRLPDALDAFRSDVDHHAADLVATSLRRAAGSHSGNLAAQLGWLAEAVRERVAAVQRVETARTETKTSARLVVIIVVTVGVGLYVLNRPLLQPYESPVGQIVLALVGGIWVGAAIWLRRLTAIPEPARVLSDDRTAGGSR
ncbi:MAG TPA: type II secretion system F family protein [Micromonosporaceae bacterium]|jgi:Flp pilus assembly protein TadB